MKYYQINDLLRVQTNLNGIFPGVYETITGNRLDLEVFVERGLVNSQVFGLEIMPGIFVNKRDSLITSIFSIAGRKIRVETQFKKEGIRAQLSPSYLWLSKYFLRMPVSSLYPVEHYIKLLTQVALLKKGFSYVIAGGVVDENKALLFSGFGGMGKTTLWHELLKGNSKMKYLGDDTLMSDGKAVYGYPKPVRIRGFGSVFWGTESHKDPGELVDNEFIPLIRPGGFVFLERGKSALKTISRSEALIKLRAINRKIMPLSGERTIMAAEYAGLLNTQDLMKTENNILKKLLGQTQNFVVRSNDVASMMNILKKI